MLRRPSFVVRCRPSVHHFQRSSSPKPLGQSRPNFMWRLHGSGKRKFIRDIWVIWPRWPPRPYIVKTLQKCSSPGPKGLWPWALVCSIGALAPSKFVQMMTLGWPWPILWQGQILFLMRLYGKELLESHLMEETYSKWPEWHEVYSDPRGLSAPAPGLYTCIKTSKYVYKIRL